MTKAKPSWDDLGIAPKAKAKRQFEPFELNQFGKPKANDPTNVEIALARLGIVLRYDSFINKNSIEGLRGFGPLVSDEAVIRISINIRDHFDFFPDENLVRKVMTNESRKNEFNSARDYFAQREDEWDGVNRLEDFLIRYAEAPDTPYVRAVGMLPFIAAVRRVRHPGAKFDEMLVLESSQGKNKSTAFEILATRPEWFSDSVPLNADNRELLEHVEGKMFVEVAELQGIRKGDVEHIKAMLSRTTDRARMAYGRTQVERPRQFVFIGTANGRTYLRDETGNRRFWPVEIHEFDLAALRRDVDLLWGEAAHLESEGISIRLDPSLYEAAGREQDKRLEIHADPFSDTIAAYLGGFTGKITSEDAWAIFDVDAGRRTPDNARRFNAAMKANGWENRSISIEGNKSFGYVKGNPNRRIVVSPGPDRRPLVEYADERDSWDA